MPEPLAIEVNDLRKVYGLRRAGASPRELLAVDGVSFAVPRGGALAIVGESGSGKTTVAQILLGLIPATSGTVAISGEPRTRLPRSRKERRRRGRQIQIVFQDPNSSLDPRQSVSRCLDEVLRLHFDLDASGRRRRVEQLADQVGLGTSLLQAVPRELSGGQRQRVAIARALAAEPEVLVLDESVAALDVSVQAQILNLLSDVRQETAVTYLFISHDLAVVRQVTDEAIVMRRGVVVERGPTAQLLDAPTEDYTRALRASVPGPGWKPQRRRVS